MSHIVRFRVDGLVGRKEPYEQTLNRDVNIFFGLNGSGKTSLLKILHSAMLGDAGTLLSVPFDHAEVVFYSISRRKSLRRTFDKAEVQSSSQLNLNLDYSSEGTVTFLPGDASLGAVPSRALPAWRDLYTWTTISPRIPWIGLDEERSQRLQPYDHAYLPTSRLYLTDEEIRGAGAPAGGVGTSISEEQLDRYFGRAMEGLWLRYAAQILSGVRAAQEGGLGRILRNILTTETPDERPSPLKELSSDIAYQRVKSFLTRQGSQRTLTSFDDFRKRYRRDSRLRSIVAEIDAVEQGIESVMAPRLKLEALVQQMFSGNKRIVFTDQAITVATDDSDNIGLEALSSGEKHLLRLFVQALLVGPSAILVDEPELSLHVDWQRKLIADFRLLNAEAQLIFATHSPEIMADVEDSKIFRL
jgi:ABC-type molybdenum transport system ATPase subunit/photorepair protein PhrA